ncbi:MAG: ATP-dependent DNA helicase RecG [Gammaproteobacteria bacterium]|jgi:ATP-dependent DNA helicase RecG|nr:ATP-dependent DNA helicase RecG [Gammaproteobacteria bacterium]
MTKPAPVADICQAPAVTSLSGVGKALAGKLARVHIHDLIDLLLHLPLRYEDRTRTMPLAQLKPGLNCLIEAEVVGSALHRGRRTSLQVQLQEQGGRLNLRFIHFHANQAKAFVRGKRIRCFGEVRPGPQGLEMVHPEYRLFTGDPPALADKLTPVYPTTEGISQTRMRQLVALAWQEYELHSHWLRELLPDSIISKHGLPPIATALKQLHFPDTKQVFELSEASTSPAYQRLIIEELLAQQLCLRQARQQASLNPAPAFTADSHTANQLCQSLPFTLTRAQQRVWHEIQTDIQQRKPMLRMVQGDVGSGKTIVAALAACQAIDAGYQVVILAPTEILAEQHLHNFQHWLQPMQIGITWLAGKQKAVERRQALAAIADGKAQVIVGTHAVFQQAVTYQHLGLVIVDEQHRFGVAQRQALLQKAPAGTTPHQLIMSATPIPRTLAMSAYGDLDHSLIDELPPGRKPINTVVISNNKRDQVIARIESACSAKQQVYWICPLIEASEELQCEAAEETAEQLTQALPRLRIGLIHGRMSADEKTTIMANFKAAELDLLVATTVIEVGVDIPNANLMIIDNAERLGLAQLHQLRGRVGRGQAHSHCLLMYQTPLARLARERLHILRQSNDGFVIAEKDLQLRGPGEVLGTRQAGAISLRIADLLRDAHLLPKVHKLADHYIQHPQHSQELIQRWVGSRQEYIAV